MSRKLSLSVAAMFMGGTALAEVPRVAVDIAPVHSLVARVMQGVGTPDLIVQTGASAHEYSLRPSEAKALQHADLVFWVSPDLTPWMKDAIQTLATDAAVTELLEADGTMELAFREGAIFEAHDDNENHATPETDHGGDIQDVAGSEDDHAHEDGAHDTHAWLAPQNAVTWLNVIAGQLSVADPENAGAYFANATAGQSEIEALTDEINEILLPVRGKRFIVFHDAYQYFEVGFDFPAAGAISLSDASAPSPARIAEIQSRIADEGIDCVLAEPQFNQGLVATVLEGTEAGTGVLDPLGSALEPGPALYPQLMRNLATALAECL
ncbi:zinc ABC transporter substrate-binding protein [Sulfitobacter sp. M13]